MKRPGMLFGGLARKRIGLLLGLLLLTLNLIWLWNLPIGQGDEPIRVRIERGSNFSQVVQQLREANLIQQPLWFEFLARLNGQHHRLQAGEFQLDPRWNHAALLNHLVSGSGLQVRVTIPEGLSYQQATARLVEQGLGQADRYATLFTDSTLRKLSGIQGLKTLEGVIYPETYFIAQESSEREILGLMIQEFNNRFTQLRSETPAEGGKKLSDHQLLILASMIEKETGTAEDRPLIAGVFHNRLRLGMKMQSDPTVIYGISNFDGNLTRKHLETPTPFNTYTEMGLPPTPISNPGWDSLHSALQPASVKYLYFVARGDGSSAFSRTLREHQRAVWKYQVQPHRNSR